jgi:tetratricopeptide (TPR) repeat protein
MAIPPQVQALHGRAVDLMRAERYGEAVAVLKGLTADGHGFPGPYLNLGIAHLALGAEGPAQEALARAIEIDPGNTVAHNQMGILHRRAGRFQEARQAYEKALARRPDYANAHLNLGILCDLYLQNRDCALEHYQRYQALSGGEDKQVSLWLADLSKRRDARGK